MEARSLICHRSSVITAVLLAILTILGALTVYAGSAPTAVSTGASGVTDNFAQLGYAITSHGSSSLTFEGVQYATDAYYDAHGNTYDQSSQSPSAFPDADNSGGAFYIYSLSCGTTYHYRAFATNGDGTGYGSDSTFTTSSCPAVAPTFADDPGATSIDSTTEEISYAVSDTGSASLTSFMIDYATDAYFTGNASTYSASTTYTGVLADSGAGNLTGLSCGTLYHYRVTLTNGDDASASSSDSTFTTSSCGGSPFDGGEGSSGAPYQISTCAQLQDMEDDLTAYYEITGDIDCSATDPTDGAYDADGPWSAGVGFIPIGSTTPFSGSLDGNSHSISGLFQGTSGYAGFFTELSGVVQDLTFSDVSISGLNNTGALVSVADEGSSILSVSVSGTVHGNDHTGGLAGTARGTIANSFASTTLSGNGNVGGLVGTLYGTTTASHAGGTVSGVNYVGGFIGLANGTTTTSYTSAVVSADHSGTYSGAFVGGVTGSISLSYATGSITGGTGVGGFAGRLESTALITNSFSRSDVQGYSSKLGGFVGSNNGSITNSYATGDVAGLGSTGTPFSVGGFAGDNDHIADDSFSAGTVTTTPSYIQVGGFAGYQDGTANDSAWWSGAYSVDVGSGPNPSVTYAIAHRDDMKDASQTFYTHGWDFATVPVWDSATGAYPLLNAGWPSLHTLAATFSAEENDTTVDDVDGGIDEGGGAGSFTSGDGSAESPYVISDCAQLMLVNDYLSDDFVLATDLDCTAYGLDAMIGSYLGQAFEGSFDGNGHTIAIELIDPTQSGLALFRAVYGGFIEDLTVNAYVIGQDVNASVVAIALNAGLENVHASSTIVSMVSDPPNYPLAGTGGLVGGFYGGLVDNSSFTGLVASPFIAGGIAGFVLNDLSGGEGAIISRSSSDATVYGELTAGGVAGYLVAGAQIRNSFSTGAVGYLPDFGTSYGVGGFGGLVGFIDQGIVSRSYAAGTVSAGSDADIYPSGGLIGIIQNASTTVVHSFSAAQVISNGASVGGFLGVLADGDGTEQFYDNYFDTGRSGLASCTMESDDVFDHCIGVDGSGTDFWLGSSSTPLWAWDTTDTWDISGAESEFPLLRHLASEPPDESDEFTGQPVDPEPEEEVSTPEHHGGGISRTKVVGRLKSFVQEGKTEGLISYVKRHAGLLKKYYARGTKLSPEVLAALGIVLPTATPPATAVTYPMRDLQLGMTGDDVRALQNLLIARASGSAAAALKANGPTGYFGPLTRAALVEYQQLNSVAPAAGYFGPLTRAQVKTSGLSGTWW